MQATSLERWFLWSLLAATVAGALTRFGVLSDVLYWPMLAFLILSAAMVAKLIYDRGGIAFATNRHKKLIIAWLIFVVVALILWSFGEKSVQSAMPFLKGSKRMWAAINDFGFFPAAFGLIVAAAVATAGSQDSDDVHQKPIERTFAMNMPAKIAGIPMALTAMVVFTGGTIWTIVYSFTGSKMLPKTKFVGLDQYERLWGTSRWIISIENLFFYGICSLVFSFVIGFVLAALLDQKIRFENTFRTILLYPFALSFIVTGLVWQWMLNPEFGVQSIFRDLGWTSFNFDPLYNADIVIYGVLIAGLWQGTGLIMVLMLAGLRGIDQEIWKASRVDGIPMWKTYLLIVIPMMRPVFITTLVIIASGIVRVYDLVVAQTGGGPGISSEVPAKYVYDNMFEYQNLGQGFAASTMMLLAVAIVIIPWAYLEFGSKNRG